MGKCNPIALKVKPNCGEYQDLTEVTSIWTKSTNKHSTINWQLHNFMQKLNHTVAWISH